MIDPANLLDCVRVMLGVGLRLAKKLPGSVMATVG